MLKELLQRPRRLRRNSIVRDLIAENRVELSRLIQPYFVSAEKNAEQPIAGFTGISRWGVEKLLAKVGGDLDRGVKNFMLFAEVPESMKDAQGSHALHADSLMSQAVRELKKRFGSDVVLFTDVCLCPATSHGHCGVISKGMVANDPSLDLLAQMALRHAEAGADFVCPSDMMDGRVLAIRRQLDNQGFSETGILAYTAKYASSYYGPFRGALGSSPGKEGPKDRATYQMDFRNTTEALRELRLDIEEGADIVMVKPALAYLDIIAKFKAESSVPVAAYSVSGEYEMVKQMAKAGLVDERALASENLTAIARAGADIIITYFASQAAEQKWFNP